MFNYPYGPVGALVRISPHMFRLQLPIACSRPTPNDRDRVQCGRLEHSDEFLAQGGYGGLLSEWRRVICGRGGLRCCKPLCVSSSIFDALGFLTLT
jgi:hypothetical protein